MELNLPLLCVFSHFFIIFLFFFIMLLVVKAAIFLNRLSWTKILTWFLVRLLFCNLLLLNLFFWCVENVFSFLFSFMARNLLHKVVGQVIFVVKVFRAFVRRNLIKLLSFLGFLWLSYGLFWLCWLFSKWQGFPWCSVYRSKFSFIKFC